MDLEAQLQLARAETAAAQEHVKQLSRVVDRERRQAATAASAAEAAQQRMRAAQEVQEVRAARHPAASQA